MTNRFPITIREAGLHIDTYTMEVLPGFFVDPQPASDRVRLTTIKLIDLLCRLPLNSFGPKFTAVRHYYQQAASTPNIEYGLLEVARTVGSDVHALADLTNTLLVLVSVTSASALSCSFRLLKWLVSQQRVFKTLQKLIESPVDYMTESPDYQALLALLFLSFIPAPTFYFGSKEGQCELIASLVVQMAPLLLLLGDFCGGAEAVEAVSVRMGGILQKAGADPLVVQVFSASIPFDPFHNHIDLGCVCLFLGSVVLLTVSYYWSVSIVR